MQKRRSIVLLVILIVSLFTVSSIPAQAAGSVTLINGRETAFDDISLSWCYAVYLAKTTGKEVTFRLNRDFTARTKDESVKINGQNYKYKKYDFGVNVRECDLGVGLTSTNTVNAYRNGALWVPPGANIVIDLNGYCIDRKVSKQRDDGEGINVESGGTLTVIDSNPGSRHDGFSGGAVTGGASGDGAGGIHVKGILNFKAGTIYNCNTNEHGGALYVSGSGVLNMTGGLVLGCRTKNSGDSCNGGAVYINGGKCSLSDCRIDGCESEDNGGAVYMNNGTLSCSGVSFVNNSAKDKGGAIYINGGNSSFRKCLFSNNRAKDDDRGGAIFVNTDSKYCHLFEECSITDNSGGEGGGMFIDDGVVDLVNCLFRDNYSDDDGGAVFANSSDGTYITDCVFENNRCDNCGGALFIDNKKVVISGAIMTGNVANDHGGAIYVDADYDLNIQGYCRIQNNYSNKRHTDNIALQTTGSKHAYLYAGSIEEGSCIHIASSKSGEQPITKKSNISQYQFSHYFVADGSTAQLKDIEERSTKFVSSVFSEKTSWILLTAGTVTAAGAAVLCVILTKRRRRTKNEH